MGGNLVIWRNRVRRRVRYHLFDGKGGLTGPSVEGFDLGRSDGHYLVGAAHHLEATGRTIPLEGVIEIPRERVLYRQVIQ